MNLGATILPETIVVMGVSGAGKSTFGSALAALLERTFVDADDLHPTRNKAKMAAGIPLTDADREPWLRVVARTARGAGPTVVACSALKRRYRDALRDGCDSVAFVELVVPRLELERRLTSRNHEFMSPTLLDSQLDVLEPLDPGESGIRFDYRTRGMVDEAAATALAALRASRIRSGFTASDTR